MDQGIRGATFQRLTNRHFNRLLSRAADPQVKKVATVPAAPKPVVGITLSIGATPKSTEPDQSKQVEGWRTKPMPADALATTRKQIIEFGEDAEVLNERPNSEDPTRLALTEQANQFALGKGDNPFAGLSRQTLSSISYDDSGTYTSTEIAAAMQEMKDHDQYFWDETYKRISDAEIKNGNQDDTRPMLIKAQLKILSSMGETERNTVDYTTESLSIELIDWENAGFDVPEAVDYPDLLEPEARVLAATTEQNGKAVWKQFSLSVLQAHTTKLSLLNALADPAATSDDAAAGKAPKGEWLQIYAEIERF
ncbi:hypothetical protein [Pseudomonas sp. GV071]|uniref:hypothetical protein n=1 Tax=Pseudomonas sp. GV071 TaxID=2135754 RepID=UPI000D3BC9B7|nr:hypothetical protein [Pseudomonas sp. GV071]PTQ70598.1 hypothetical protein C8K61_106325 [Pseudomonas sp. GV071]